MKKTIAIAVLCLFSSTYAFAGQRQPLHQPVLKTWHHAMQPKRVLSPSDAKTLSEAAIILYGNKSMRVEKIETVKNQKGKMRYLIKISDKMSHEMKSLLMNPHTGKLSKAKHQPK